MLCSVFSPLSFRACGVWSCPSSPTSHLARSMLLSSFITRPPDTHCSLFSTCALSSCSFPSVPAPLLPSSIPPPPSDRAPTHRLQQSCYTRNGRNEWGRKQQGSLQVRASRTPPPRTQLSLPRCVGAAASQHNRSKRYLHTDSFKAPLIVY